MKILVRKVRKRDGRIVDFDLNRIIRAIAKALEACNEDASPAKDLALDVVKVLNKKYGSRAIPTVENIQDIVISILKEKGFKRVAKAYEAYRRERASIREEKKRLLNKDSLDEVDKRFSLNAIKLLASRYLNKNKDGDVIESPKELFQRVAINIALPEILYDPILKKNIRLKRSKGKMRIGKYTLNKYHIERLKDAFELVKKEKRLRVDFDTLLALIKRGDFDKYEYLVDTYYSLMSNQVFLPNTPALINSGNRLGLLAACFTLDVEDSIASIMDAAKDVALIQKAGGGTGMNFSKIRPRGDIVKSTMGVASGPLSFMELIDKVSDVIKQGGVRRGANMGILEIWHPQIDEFIALKSKEGKLENFNISVGIWEDFWDHLAKKKKYPLRNPRNGEVWKEVDPRMLLHTIAYSAWLSAEPGVLFFDNINKRNVLIPAKGKIWITNPCSEEPLYPYESCNLGSINLIKFVEGGEKKWFNWKKFRDVVKVCLRALDNMILMTKFPIEKIKEETLKTRRVGLGMMGLADTLYALGIKYNSKEGYEFMLRVAENLTYFAYKESIKLARERSPFPLFKKTDYVKGELPIELYYERKNWSLDWDSLVKDIKKYGLRNAMVTTCAPTGSISMIADTSNGIEPNFSLAFVKKISVGKFYYVNKILEDELKRRGLYSKKLIKKIIDNGGTLNGLDEIPKDMKRIFVTAMDMSWKDHIIAQATLQKAITDSISKTINMPQSATVKDVEKAYILAHKLGCKGLTVYRYGSRRGQVYTTMEEGKKCKCDILAG